MSEVVEIDVTVIGAGIVGLAVAETITRESPDLTVLVVDRHFKFGQESSSHNSEVIHAGIYYKPGSYKAAACVRGKKLLYKFCEKYDVPFNNCGKHIVATDPSQLPKLQDIYKNSLANGVELQFVEGNEAVRQSGIPGLTAALWSDTTGVVDSHVMMDRLAHLAEERGALLMYNHRLTEVTRADENLVEFNLQSTQGEHISVCTRYFVNTAGMGAARIANLFQTKQKIEHRPCRGRYFGLGHRFTGKYKSLIYPLPDPAGGLGVHLTVDLSGRGRLGPDVDWSEQHHIEPDDMLLYKFTDKDASEQKAFWQAGGKFLPDLQFDDLTPDYIGVRSKLFIDGRAHQEFVLTDFELKVPQAHLLGIESPGVTASLALAEDVGERVKQCLGGAT